MQYLRVPDQIRLKDLCEKDCSFSPGLYRKVVVPTSQVQKLKDLLDFSHPFDKGSEPGSLWYMSRSTHFFVRTKALQEHSYLLYPKGDSIIPINPRVFEDFNLSAGDILMSKDSNIGECATVDGDSYKNHMFSGGIVRLHPATDRYYLIAFLKHPIFKLQLEAMVARAATIAHAKTLWLDCVIPFPSQENSGGVVQYVSVLAQAIIDKEITIRQRDGEISRLINEELDVNGTPGSAFVYSYPTTLEIQKRARLDAVIYDREYKQKIHRILNYKFGTCTPSEMGFTITPGPSLEIKILGTRLDSDVPKPGFYKLVLPTNISEYGTLNVIQYLGTARKLPLLKQGDIVFGEAGFHKGRSLVLIDAEQRCTTNAHGLYARHSDADLVKSIFFRCIFNWYRNMRLIDIVAVGGSGGHLSLTYFDELIRLPRFSEAKQLAIAGLYHTPAPRPLEALTLDNFVDWHRRWNSALGIWELDREIKVLQRALSEVQEQIIQGKKVSVAL